MLEELEESELIEELLEEESEDIELEEDELSEDCELDIEDEEDEESLEADELIDDELDESEEALLELIEDDEEEEAPPDVGYTATVQATHCSDAAIVKVPGFSEAASLVLPAAATPQPPEASDIWACWSIV